MCVFTYWVCWMAICWTGMISCDRQSFYVKTPGPRILSPSRLGGNISGVQRAGEGETGSRQEGLLQGESSRYLVKSKLTKGDYDYLYVYR